jgi:hypothetical protein
MEKRMHLIVTDLVVADAASWLQTVPGNNRHV